MIYEVNNKTNINKKQNKQIAALQKKFAQLKAMKSMPKKTRRAVTKRNRISSSKHPLAAQVKALVNPFDSTPGIAKHLVDPLPSQSYKLKSRATITVGNSHTLVGLISPCFGDESVPLDYPSAIFVSGSGSQITNTILSDGSQAGTSFVKSGTTAPISSRLAPIRPYFLSTQGASWRLVSYGVRLRYTGTALNANGTLKYLPNDLGAMSLEGNYNTFQKIADYVDGNSHTILRSIYDKAVYEFSGLGSTEWMHGRECYPAVHDEGDTWGATATQSEAPTYWEPRLIGQNSSTTYFGIPGMVFTYTNNTSSNVQFEVELVENWEVRSPTNTAFHTDSHGNPEISQEVFRTVVSGHMHAAASSAPTVMKSLKAVNAASKSPLGKAVIAAALA